MATPLLVDYRRGSHELVDPLMARGLDVAETELVGGDLAFEGRGNQGAKVDIGIEFKMLEELVSSLVSQRLQGHQLPKMRAAAVGKKPLYDFAYLLTEGEIHFDKRGLLTKRVGRRDFRPLPGRMTISEFYKRLITLHLCGGLIWLHTHSRRATLELIESLYHTWTDKALDEHTSHLALYQPQPMLAVSDFRDVVSRLPGVSLRNSLALEKAFDGSLRRAFTAGPATWAKIDVMDKNGKTRKFSRKIADKIEEVIR